jgi:hypothetical protein
LDKFNFASALTSSSTPSVAARVTALQNTNSNAQAGVMLRESTDGNAPFAALTVSPAGAISFRSRTVIGGTVSSVVAGENVIPPLWLKLNHTGGIATGSYSKDNISWTLVGSIPLSFANSPQAGLAVCAGTDTLRNISTFTDVAVDNLPPVMTAYTVSTSSRPAGAGTTSGSGIFQSGTSVSAIATPSSGYGFAAWSEGGISAGISPAYPFAVNGNRTLVANFQPASLATFKSSNFSTEELNQESISGGSADPDRDGFSNLMEYALAMNPKLANSPPIQGGLADGVLSLTYKRSKTAADLTYLVEVSGDLMTWKSGSSDVGVPVIGNDDGYTQTVVVKDLMAPSPAGRFIRLRVSAP